MFFEEHPNENHYVDDFKNIKNLLTKKYGSPTKNREDWKNRLYKNDYSRRGFAVCLGYLSYTCQWEIDETEIVSHLSGENYMVTHWITYQSRFFKKAFEKTAKEKRKAIEEEKKATEKEILKDF